MSYIGVVPRQPREQRRLGSITKTGSGHARRLLIEAAWHYRPPRPRQSAHRAPRRPATDSRRGLLEAQLRLHRTWTRLEARAKRRTLIAVAAAREPAGFCWAITQIELPANSTQEIPSAGSVAARQRAGNPRHNYEQPPLSRLATLDTRQRLPTTNHGPAAREPTPEPAYISLTRVAHSTPDRHPPSRPHTVVNPTSERRKFVTHPLTSASPYQ